MTMTISPNAVALAVLLPFAASQLSQTVAQGRHVLDADTASSAFTFSGTVNISGIRGNIVGKPPNFNVSGAIALDLTVQNGAVTTGQFVAGKQALTIPTLNAQVPNIFPFLPPLATIVVKDATFQFISVDQNGAPASFPIAQTTGAFTTDVIAEILGGSITFNALGQMGTIQLGGVKTAQQQITGTVVSTSTGFRLDVPIASVFQFTDPGSGASGTFNLNGVVVANDRGLAAGSDEISLAVGGTQVLTLSAGTAHAGRAYFMVGSLSGTTPGINVGAVNVPINHDGYFELTLTSPNGFPLGNSFATLDPLGVNQTTFTFPAFPNPALVGWQFHHAYVLIDTTSTIIAASNAVPLSFVQ